MLIMTFMHFSVKSSWMAHNQFEMCGFSYKSKRYSSKWGNSMCRINKAFIHTMLPRLIDPFCILRNMEV